MSATDECVMWSYDTESGSNISQATLDFIEASISELLGSDFQTIQGCQYSSEGMNELQNFIYLIEQTDKILFQNDEQYIMSIIRDELSKYDSSQKAAANSNDIAELVLIIKKFINWHDTANRFNYKPIEIFSSKSFEILSQSGHSENELASFLIYRAQQKLKALGQENLAEEIKIRSEGLGFTECLEMLREYIDFQDSEKVY